jgi:hypothetical protein
MPDSNIQNKRDLTKKELCTPRFVLYITNISFEPLKAWVFTEFLKCYNLGLLSIYFFIIIRKYYFRIKSIGKEILI